MIDRTAQTLKEMGLKITPQRQAILQLLNGNTTHPSADSVYREILRRYPAISFATVYNTLSRLAATGNIQELDIDPNKKRFDPCTAPHYHLYCRMCGSVFDLLSDVPSLPDITQLRARTVDGHRVDAVQLNIKGICRDCLNGESGARRPRSRAQCGAITIRRKKEDQDGLPDKGL
jgi:Fur family transcriptional regulator, peroxide stress response regulator